MKKTSETLILESVLGSSTGVTWFQRKDGGRIIQYMWK